MPSGPPALKMEMVVKKTLMSFKFIPLDTFAQNPELYNLKHSGSDRITISLYYELHNDVSSITFHTFN